ncbi:MAG: DUF4198 domain-containing protein [bacterium]|nr:DUF4198 domain-containing protein [bacterium]
MKIKRLIGALVVLVWLLPAGIAMAGTVKGTIKIHGQLTAGVTLKVEFGDRKVQATVSDRNGNFSLNVPKSGSWILTIAWNEKHYSTKIQVQTRPVTYSLELVRLRSGSDKLIKR